MKTNTKFSIRTMAVMAMIAAIYAAVTVAQAAIGFGPIQFRIAESLNLLVFFNPLYMPAVLLGVFIANFIASPYGLVDVIVGTGASFIALALILLTKKLTNNLFVASLWPTIVNALMIPLVFLIYAGEGVSWEAFLPFAASVAIGQFVVVTIFGYILLRFLMAKYPKFIEIITVMRVG
ncbi:MAG: QueT transporter family protein [Defluviitaleaceae bacterium]|nr:QueT transporter family protein [Defluviitaleaceae bacterium]